MERRRDGRAMGRGWFGLLSLWVMFECLSPAGANPPLTPPAGLVASGQPVTRPTFRLPSVAGGTVDAATLHGKVVVVQFAQVNAPRDLIPNDDILQVLRSLP